MSDHPHCVYHVIIRHNLVVAIEAVPIAPGARREDDPLAVTSRLAANHQANGCLDGTYELADVEAARHFARLSLDFAARMIEKTGERLDAARITGVGWTNPFLGECAQGRTGGPAS
ncbi:MAG: hypothetical protein GC150_05765 [Rhizobiales bacterium]|nr:hypothetical protein [Hyphomicrobiales bacterium]